MKKKYVIILIVIAVLFVATLSIGTGYGLWMSSKTTEESNINDIDCFRVYYSDNGYIEQSKIEPLINSDGEETSPYNITITNMCETKQEVQIRLNTLNTTTIDTNALVIKTTGNITKEATLYKNLETTKTSEENVATSKLVGKITIGANETIRTNIKIWFDEKKAPNVDDTNNYYKGHVEIIGTNSAIKPSLVETILKDKTSIEAKGNPTFTATSTTEDGLYATDAANGKYYYYRGVVNNNYVKFSNNIWRIVGVNSDGSIKLILEQPSAITRYSSKHNYADYSGFKYDYNNVDVNNDVLNSLETWYQNNIETEADKYVVEQSYCNDSSYRTSGYNDKLFGAYDRVISNYSPSAICPTTSNDFGGNYNLKIGLITADEVALAGGVSGIENYNYYLYNGSSFFTASPSQYSSNTSNMITVASNGSITEAATDSEQGLRPVINITGTVTYTGSGTKENPYILDIE